MGLPNRVFHSGATSESHISLLHGLSKMGFSGGLRQVAFAEVLQAAVTGVIRAAVKGRGCKTPIGSAFTAGNCLAMTLL